MANFNPKAFCLDRVARRAGNRTYLKIKLDLKPEQMTAWDAFAKASDAADVKDTARCNALPSDMKERPNYVDRLTMEETYMKARVERIEAVKPSLTGALQHAVARAEDGARPAAPDGRHAGPPSRRRAALSLLLGSGPGGPRSGKRLILEVLRPIPSRKRGPAPARAARSFGL